eukprot:2747767-Rhodomonas_salina.1
MLGGGSSGSPGYWSVIVYEWLSPSVVLTALLAVHGPYKAAATDVEEASQRSRSALSRVGRVSCQKRAPPPPWAELSRNCVRATVSSAFREKMAPPLLSLTAAFPTKD